MSKPIRNRVLLVTVAFGLIIAAMLALCGWIYDWSYVEKVLTRLAMPTGALWVGLLFAAFTALVTGQRRWAAAALVFSLFYWTLGCTYTANGLIRRLEGRYEPVDPTAVPEFDLVIVLGGATFSNALGDVWLSPHGDRVMLASRLFHQGKVKQLVTTGKLYDWYRDTGIDMSMATEKIWSELGISPDRITKLGGRNTTQEMQALREFLGDNPPGRVGLLTSAFHMPRALRLAERQGLKFIPVPAGMLAVDDPPPLSWIPSAYGFRLSELATKEFLAALVDR